MRTLHFTKHRTLGRGHHCWDVSIEGHVIRKGLTRKEAIDWIQAHEQTLKRVIAAIVSRELDAVTQFAQSHQKEWRA